MYKSVINFIPKVGNDFPSRIANWVSEGTRRYETVSYSKDDTLSLVSTARKDSVVRIWNANFHAIEDVEFVTSNWPNIEWRHMPGLSPYIVDVQESLASDGSYPRRKETEITAIAVHHTVSWDAEDSTLLNAQKMARYHVNTRGWAGLGYHFVIGPVGDILRANEILDVSYHCGTLAAPGDENRISIGIALGGDFRYTPPTGAQIGAASALVADLRDYLPNSIAVLPHKRMPGASTVCPGYGIESWLRYISGQNEWI